MPLSEHKFNSMLKLISEKLQQFASEHGDKPLVNLVIPVTSFDLLSLLKGQTSTAQAIFPRIYWQDKERLQTIACFGAIEKCEHIPQPAEQECYFGGLAFQQHGQQWPDFPAILFIRPTLEFRLVEQSLSLTCHFNGQNSIQSTLELVQGLQRPQALAAISCDIMSRKDSPDQKKWAELVELAIEYKALIPKVVLSRETELVCAKSVNHWDLINQWQHVVPNSFHFVFQFSKEHAYIGCSPERLFSREKDQLKTEALAGTVNRGRDQREDTILLNSLLNDKKIDRENYLVQEFIISNLKGLKAQICCGTPYVMQLKNVQHLCVPINATIESHTTDANLLYKLHPTPAVGGSPKRPAVQFIEDNEPHLRGWYAGTVGYLRAEKSDFSVAIRTALISDKTIKLFAGAGIVTGSVAEQEWQELNYKIHTILDILSTS